MSGKSVESRTLDREVMGSNLPEVPKVTLASRSSVCQIGTRSWSGQSEFTHKLEQSTGIHPGFKTHAQAESKPKRNSISGSTKHSKAFKIKVCAFKESQYTRHDHLHS